MKYLIPILLISITARSQNIISISNSANKSILAEFVGYKKTYFGAGVSFFYNKGNKGKDYTNFISDYSSVYETINSKSGSIYFIVGNKMSKRIDWLMKFGIGVVSVYKNGKGIPGMPEELWYTMNKGYNEILIGTYVQYLINPLYIKAGWDSFNSFNFGISLKL